MMLENKNKVSAWAHPEFDPWESRDSGSKANETIDRLIGINDIKIGNTGYFTNNILESLLNKEIASLRGKDSPDLQDLINISFGGKFGKDKNLAINTNIGPSSNLGFNLSKRF